MSARKNKMDDDLIPILARAALRVAAEAGYAGLSVRAVAEAADVPEARVRAQAADSVALLHLVFRWVDWCVGDEVAGGIDPEGPEKDRLFEVMMARFDVLQSERAGFLGLIGDVRRDPCALVTTLPVVGASMAEMLHLAGVTPTGARGALRVAGLMALYLHVLRVWASDDSPDLSRTMAALDTDLTRAARVEAWFMP